MGAAGVGAEPDGAAEAAGAAVLPDYDALLDVAGDRCSPTRQPWKPQAQESADRGGRQRHTRLVRHPDRVGERVGVVVAFIIASSQRAMSVAVEQLNSAASGAIAATHGGTGNANGS